MNHTHKIVIVLCLSCSFPVSSEADEVPATRDALRDSVVKKFGVHEVVLRGAEDSTLRGRRLPHPKNRRWS